MLKEIFEKNKNIIINTDIDGILSGAILQKYYGCKIVGFSNSKDKIWVHPKIKDIYKPIYIDLYVNRPDVICIEQHIISFDKKHHRKIKKYGTKINPNLERDRTFVGDMNGGFAQKYPFGTVHYLIALMGKEGKEVELPNLDEEWIYDDKCCTVGNLILRADDALFSTFKYRENAEDWWNWFGKSKSHALSNLREYAYKNLVNAKKYKDMASNFLKAFKCDKSDGTFMNITDEYGNIYESFRFYIKEIAKIVGMKINIPRKYIIHIGEDRTRHCTEETNMEILKSDVLYSYAFVYSPQSSIDNFSYTIDME